MDRKVTFYSEGTPCVGILGLPDDYKSGDKRGAVIFCHGFTGVKEMYLPENAKRLQAEGYVTLNFDYRYFGESGGEPRCRLIPMAQVADIRNAITYMQGLPEVNPDRIGLYGTSFGVPMSSIRLALMNARSALSLSLVLATANGSFAWVQTLMPLCPRCRKPRPSLSRAAMSPTCKPHV